MGTVKRTFIGLGVGVLLAGALVGGVALHQYTQQRTRQRDLDLARQLIQDDRPEEAVPLLANHLDRMRPTTASAEEFVRLYLIALEGAGETEMLLAWAERVLDPEGPWAPPASETWARAHLILGERALAEQQWDAALLHFDAVLTASGKRIWGRDRARWGHAQVTLEGHEKRSAARRELLDLMTDLSPDDALYDDVAAALGDLNLRFLLTPAPQPGDELYSIQRGDSLHTIARRFKVSPELLMRVNHIQTPRQLTVSRRIKVPTLDFSIRVDKTRNTLTLLNGGEFFKEYTVRTGRYDYMTPNGEFRIQNKKVDPPWNNPRDHRRYPPGDPDNELGCRWMGFVGCGIGIHETIDPTTLGQYASNGCVGMAKDDVIELFDLIRVGTPVTIVGHGQDTTP